MKIIIAGIGGVGAFFGGLLAKNFFGNEEVEISFLARGEHLREIQAAYSKNISSILWEKFIFISPTATATSYFDLCLGELLTDEEKIIQIKALIEEVIQVTKVLRVAVSEVIAEQTLTKMKSLPFESTSSMHSDFKNKKAVNELEPITRYVVGEGRKNKIATPTFGLMYEELKQK